MAYELQDGNRVDLLESGREYFPALLAALAAARREIYLETYIYADDPAGRAIADALEAAARRGVVVRVLVDGFGAVDFPRQFMPRLAASGVQALMYRPELARLRMQRNRLRRLHRKLTVIDAQTAFVGGINVIDDDNAPAALRPRFDYAVRLQGPTVCAVHASVRRLWEIVSWASFRHRYRLPAATPDHCMVAGVQKAAFLVRDNLRHRNTIANAYLDAIQQAQQEILIANAYFMPGWRFRHALRQAARRGVRITVLLQGKTDHPLMHYATQALYGSLLKEGMRIFEYRRSFLHAKVAVVDGNWATVGSSNIDPFSLLLAREGNIVVDDAAFAATLRQRLERAIADGAQAITSSDVEHAGWLRRLLRWCSYGLVRSLVGIVGYSPRYWHDENARQGEGTDRGD